ATLTREMSGVDSIRPNENRAMRSRLGPPLAPSRGLPCILIQIGKADLTASRIETRYTREAVFIERTISHFAVRQRYPVRLAGDGLTVLAHKLDLNPRSLLPV